MAAWNALYVDADGIVERRGRWTQAHLLSLLTAANIPVRDARFPAAVAAKLSQWLARTRSEFALPGLPKRLSAQHLIPLKTVFVADGRSEEEDAAAALERYHSSNPVPQAPGQQVFDAEWTARFFRRCVVVAGPGLGKSTLADQLAVAYAKDFHSVLRMALKPVAASMNSGIPFEDAVLRWGLDGSGVTPEQFRQACADDVVLIADGLDDCGSRRHDVAEALANFAEGRPRARVIVTTRPIGYDSAALATWRHYVMLPPETNARASNLAALLTAAGSVEAGAALQTAKRELGRTTAAAAIGSSPQMLGMAASLIARHGALPTSRPELYGEMIKLLQRLPRVEDGLPVDADVAEHVLDILAWRLAHDPLVDAEAVIQACAVALALELGVKPLAAVKDVRAAIGRWEAAGLVERLHHHRTSLYTFVHRSFMEFAAARFLSRMPLAERGEALARIVDDAGWAEVVSFAGGLGLGDEIAGLFVVRHAGGDTSQMVRALSLLGDADACISDDYARKLVETAFDAIEERESEGDAIGVALTELATARSDLVGLAAQARLNVEGVRTRLVAWTSATAAGPAFYEPSEALSTFQALRIAVPSPLRVGLLGGFIFRGGSSRDLIQSLALAVLDHVPDDGLEVFVASDLNGDTFNTVGFLIKLQSKLILRGMRTEKLAALKNLSKTWGSSMANYAALASIPNKWNDAANAALRAIAQAVTTAEAIQSVDATPRALPHFSALFTLTGLLESAVSDIYAWEHPPTTEVTREVFRLLTGIVPLRRESLMQEAANVVRRLDAEPGKLFSTFQFPSLDVPEPAWAEVVRLRPDRTPLLKALQHRSEWFVTLAANLLRGSSLTEDDVKDLLASGSGLTLAAAGHLALTCWPARAVDLLLDRLEESRDVGFSCLYNVLLSAKPPAGNRLARVLMRDLFDLSVSIAEAAATLATDLVERGVFTDLGLLERAFKHWAEHEQPTPEVGIVPWSPRATLLKALLAARAVEDDRLIGLLADLRHDVRSIAEAALGARLQAQGGETDGFVNAILEGRVPARAITDLLSRPLPLSAEQVETLEALLCSTEAPRRRAGMTLLRIPYMDPSNIAAWAKRLLNDNAGEIREAARRLLKATKS